MRRLSRRTFLAGAGAATAGVAATAAALAWPRSSSTPPPAPTPQPSATPARTPTPSPPPPTPTPLPPSGAARLPAFGRLVYDTFHVLRSVEPAVPVILGHSHSRLIRWAEPAAGVLGGDLAASWEQQEGSSMVVTLDPRAHWHAGPVLEGRQVSAADVVAHFERLLALREAGTLSPSLTQHFATLESVTELPGNAVGLHLSGPDALFLGALASPFALIQHINLVEDLERAGDRPASTILAGSGPFAVRDLAGPASFVAHTAGHLPPGLEALTLEQPNGAGPAARQRFLERAIDQFVARDRRDAAALESEAPEAFSFQRHDESPTISTFFVGAPPWNNPGLLLALSAALNRFELAERLHGGRAAPAGPVGPSRAFFSLPESELVAFPGFNPDPAADASDARSRWEAAAGPALGPITFDIPTIYDPLYSASSVIPGLITEIFGPGAARAEVHSYPVISGRAVAREYGSGQARTWFGWAPPIDDADPTRELYSTFHSASPGSQPFGLDDPALDALLDAARSEFDLEARAARIREVSAHLLALGGAGVLPWLQQWSTVFRHPYLHGPPPNSFAALDPGLSLRADLSHPDYPTGRQV